MSPRLYPREQQSWQGGEEEQQLYWLKVQTNASKDCEGYCFVCNADNAHI